jgi:hypothetical protein
MPEMIGWRTYGFREDFCHFYICDADCQHNLRSPGSRQVLTLSRDELPENGNPVGLLLVWRAEGLAWIAALLILKTEQLPIILTALKKFGRGENGRRISRSGKAAVNWIMQITN